MIITLTTPNLSTRKQKNALPRQRLLFPILLANEGSSRSRLLLLRQLLLCSVEHLEEQVDARAHSDVEVRLRALEVVVEVVTELDQHVQRLLDLPWREVSVLEHERHVSVRVETAAVRDVARRLSELHVDRWRARKVLREFGEEHFAEDDVVDIGELDREDHRNTVAVCLHPHGLIRTVVDLHDVEIASVQHGVASKSDRSSDEIAMHLRNTHSHLLDGHCFHKKEE